MKRKKYFKERFSFDDKGIEQAHRFLIQTIIDNRSCKRLVIKVLFYIKDKRFPCAMIKFRRTEAKPQGVYGMQGQNEVALMRKMLAWQRDGNDAKSDVVGTLIGRDVPVEDFKKFRQLVEASGVIIEKSRLISGTLA